MTDPVSRKFRNLTIWRRGDERAPHKPLLALWAIGRCLRGEDRLVEYSIVEGELTGLLKKFGPYRSRHRPWDPFWRLQKNEVWDIPRAGEVRVVRGGVSPVHLRDLGIAGGLPEPIHDLFCQDRAEALRVAHELASAHFPETMRGAVLEATLGAAVLREDVEIREGVDNRFSDFLESTIRRRRRNPAFRKKVLGSYDFRCAVCEFSLEFPSKNWPALEAAHIQWHSHSGPDKIRNGLSLCLMHHELFDWGAFTIRPKSLDIVVADALVEQDSSNWLQDIHGRPLAVKPDRKKHRPATEYLEWHGRNVFRGPAFPKEA